MHKREQSNLFVTLDALVSLDHPYRNLDRLLPFNELRLTYQGLYSPKGRKEKGFEFGLRALIIQFMEDLSVRSVGNSGVQRVKRRTAFHNIAA